MQSGNVENSGSLRPTLEDRGRGALRPTGIRRAVSRNGRCHLRNGNPWLGGVVSTARGEEQGARTVSCGGQCASGRGASDGGAVGPRRGSLSDGGHDFDLRVPSGGYAWWYIDGLSDDGRFGVTVIAFLGSAFSPYYAWRSRKAGEKANPYDHVSINVAVYGAGGYRWSMTERGEHALLRRRDSLSIGPSRLAWSTDGSLVIDIDEIAVPIPRRIRGRLLVRPEVRGDRAFQLDPSGRHVWQPIAPRARIDVEWANPPGAWTGSAYVDHNRGDEPLVAAFRGWGWSRSIESERTRIFYDLAPTCGASRSLVIEYGSSGTPHEIEAPPLANYGRSMWRLPLAARSDPGVRPRMLERWEDGPFYARSLIEHVVCGEPIRSVHETLSLERLALPLVQAMLPFRMPRRG